MASQEKVFSPAVLMIDLETLSTRPDAYITQAGYVVGNVLTGELLAQPRDVNLMVPGVPTRGSHIDIATIQWWMKQSDAARKGVFDSGILPCSPHHFFSELQSISREHGEGLTVWASPAMFDLPILTHAWNGHKPWRYSQERDMMTLYKLVDPHGMLKPAPIGEQHVASADANWQFRYLHTLVNHLTAMDPQSWGGVLDRAEAA